ncbi:RNA-binding domain-containing protein [Polaribacter tangerinus]|uniref:RNA-binding domain-containing protein n=1 Tax=Polaribacter tangerinus TaxID=1920034 RepID=UPI000B4C0F45|nr:RNA-binding domain-containing protein [Polaribacter tangerinus]
MDTTLDALLSLSTENESVEFKEAKNQIDKDKLGKYFSALSNEANLANKPNAWLVLGIKNNKSIVGTAITDKQLNEYKAEIVKHTSPKTNFISTKRVSQDGSAIILLEIPAAPKGFPLSWKGHCYGRDGESLGALSSDEYDRIKLQNKTEDWSAKIVKNATLQDLSEEAVKQARVRYTQKNPKLEDTIKSWSDAVFLNKAKLTIKDKITNTAIILLGKPESEHFLSPATSKITWILKDSDNLEKDYEHFTCPLLLNIEGVYSKIRNLKYRYIADGTLFPDEVDQYDPYIIREALNNCIAHQDYTLGSKILVVENENATLTFANSGDFIPKSIETVIQADAPEPKYRNKFLADAMVNLNMIDTIGSGIKKMYNIQRKKYFPLPDYDLSNHKVKVVITGKVVDINYARKVAQMPNLSLEEIILLDKVAKNKIINDEEIKTLKSKKLIEGRKPNFHISSKVASATNQKGDYIKMRGIDNDYIQKIITDYLTKFESAKRSDLENILFNKLSEGLDISQKINKIKNALQSLKKQGIIVVEGKLWKMSKQD